MLCSVFTCVFCRVYLSLIMFLCFQCLLWLRYWSPPLIVLCRRELQTSVLHSPVLPKVRKKNFLPVSCYYKEPLWRTICELLLNDVFTVVKHTEINSNLKLAQRAHTVSQPSLGSSHFLFFFLIRVHCMKSL